MSEQFGGYVEIDHFSASREVAFMLGAREAIDRHLDKLDHIISIETNPVARLAYSKYRELMATDRDEISVALARKAIDEKSGRFETLKKD